MANTLYTRISEKYSDRTILLDSGNINSNNFKIAPEEAKTMHALYYLETMEYILKQELKNTSLFSDEKEFYKVILTNYHSILGEKYELISDADLQSSYMKIKDISNKAHESPTAKALTTAIERLYIKPFSIDLEANAQNKNLFFNATSSTNSIPDLVQTPVSIQTRL